MSPPPSGGMGGDSLFLTDSVTGSEEYGSCSPEPVSGGEEPVSGFAASASGTPFPSGGIWFRSAGTVFLSISRRKPGRPCTIAFSMCPLSTSAAIWLRTLRSVCLVFAERAACEGQHSPVSPA